MKSSAQSLYEIGCGNEIVRCQQERGEIVATINNSKNYLKYLKYALNSGIYDCNEYEWQKDEIKLNLERIKPLVEKFKELYGKSYSNLIKTL